MHLFCLFMLMRNLTHICLQARKLLHIVLCRKRKIRAAFKSLFECMNFHIRSLKATFNLFFTRKTLHVKPRGGTRSSSVSKTFGPCCRLSGSHKRESKSRKTGKNNAIRSAKNKDFFSSQQKRKKYIETRKEVKVVNRLLLQGRGGGTSVILQGDKHQGLSFIWNKRPRPWTHATFFGLLNFN